MTDSENQPAISGILNQVACELEILYQAVEHLGGGMTHEQTSGVCWMLAENKDRLIGAAARIED